MGNEIRVILFRERYLDELKDIVKKIKNDQRINNWVQLSTGEFYMDFKGLDFDTMKKLIDDHGKVLSDTVGEEKGSDV